MMSELFKRYIEEPRKQINPLPELKVVQSTDEQEDEDVIMFMEIRDGKVTWKRLF